MFKNLEGSNCLGNFTKQLNKTELQKFPLQLTKQSRYAECEETPLLFSLLHKMKRQLKGVILVKLGRLNGGNHRISGAPLYIKH